VADSSITDVETGLIKRMFMRGMSPSLIQSYFTRPDRLVNPARIQEIKSGRRGATVASATEAALDDFLDEFARSHPQSGLFAPPKQEASASTFKIEGDRIEIVPDSPVNVIEGPAEIIDLYKEVRSKVEGLAALGHNSLGSLRASIDNFRDAFPEDHTEASAVKIWMRGNTLRSILKSDGEYKKNSDLYPLVEIDQALYPLFEDLVQSFNVLVEFIPSLSQLDEKKVDGDKAEKNRLALHAISPVAGSIDAVTTEEAGTALQEQLEAGLAAPDTEVGRRQLHVAHTSWRNFSISVFTPIYRVARMIFADDKLPNVVRKFRDGAAMEAGAQFVKYLAANYPNLVSFIRENTGHLSEYAGTVIDNPALAEFIKNLLSLVS
jgi:hypothetical protein